MSRRWMRTEPSAEYLGIKPATLVAYRHKKIGPVYSKLGKIAVYDVADLDAWAEARRVEPSMKNSSDLEAA